MRFFSFACILATAGFGISGEDFTSIFKWSDFGGSAETKWLEAAQGTKKEYEEGNNVEAIGSLINICKSQQKSAIMFDFDLTLTVRHVTKLLLKTSGYPLDHAAIVRQIDERAEKKGFESRAAASALWAFGGQRRIDRLGKSLRELKSYCPRAVMAVNSNGFVAPILILLEGARFSKKFSTGEISLYNIFDYVGGKINAANPYAEGEPTICDASLNAVPDDQSASIPNYLKHRRNGGASSFPGDKYTLCADIREELAHLGAGKAMGLPKGKPSMVQSASKIGDMFDRSILIDDSVNSKFNNESRQFKLKSFEDPSLWLKANGHVGGSYAEDYALYMDLSMGDNMEEWKGKYGENEHFHWGISPEPKGQFAYFFKKLKDAGVQKRGRNGDLPSIPRGVRAPLPAPPVAQSSAPVVGKILLPTRAAEASSSSDEDFQYPGEWTGQADPIYQNVAFPPVPNAIALPASAPIAKAKEVPPKKKRGKFRRFLDWILRRKNNS